MHPARGTITAVVVDTCIDGARVACNAGEIEPDRRRFLLIHLGNPIDLAAPHRAHWSGRQRERWRVHSPRPKYCLHEPMLGPRLPA